MIDVDMRCRFIRTVTFRNEALWRVAVCAGKVIRAFDVSPEAVIGTRESFVDGLLTGRLVRG